MLILECSLTNCLIYEQCNKGNSEALFYQIIGTFVHSSSFDPVVDFLQKVATVRSKFFISNLEMRW